MGASEMVVMVPVCDSLVGSSSALRLLVFVSWAAGGPAGRTGAGRRRSPLIGPRRCVGGTSIWPKRPVGRKRASLRRGARGGGAS
ncbi:unnamed protein product [Arctogadus glacialis]